MVRNLTFNLSVLSSLWKRLHRWFGSFRFHRLDRFYRLQCFYPTFRFYCSYRFYRSFDFYFEYIVYNPVLELSLAWLFSKCKETFMRLFYLCHSPTKYSVRICIHTWWLATWIRTSASRRCDLTRVQSMQFNCWCFGLVRVSSSAGHRWLNTCSGNLQTRRLHFQLLSFAKINIFISTTEVLPTITT